jgi:hypothetical protein
MTQLVMIGLEVKPHAWVDLDPQLALIGLNLLTAVETLGKLGLDLQSTIAGKPLLGMRGNGLQLILAEVKLAAEETHRQFGLDLQSDIVKMRLLGMEEIALQPSGADTQRAATVEVDHRPGTDKRSGIQRGTDLDLLVNHTEMNLLDTADTWRESALGLLANCTGVHLLDTADTRR